MTQRVDFRGFGSHENVGTASDSSAGGQVDQCRLCVALAACDLAVQCACEGTSDFAGLLLWE